MDILNILESFGLNDFAKGFFIGGICGFFLANKYILKTFRKLCARALLKLKAKDANLALKLENQKLKELLDFEIRKSQSLEKRLNTLRFSNTSQGTYTRKVAWNI